MKLTQLSHDEFDSGSAKESAFVRQCPSPSAPIFHNQHKLLLWNNGTRQAKPFTGTQCGAANCVASGEWFSLPKKYRTESIVSHNMFRSLSQAINYISENNFLSNVRCACQNDAQHDFEYSKCLWMNFVRDITSLVRSGTKWIGSHCGRSWII